MKICNRSLFCFSSINCNTYMSNFPVTLSEISHLSISGLQHEDRHPHTPTFTTKGSRSRQAEANCDTSSELEIFHAVFNFFSRISTQISIFLNYFGGKRLLMSSSLGGCKENCTIGGDGVICREHCLKWPLLLLQPFLCIGTIKNMDLLFLFVHFHNLSPIAMQHIITRSVFMSLNTLLHFFFLNRVLKRK